MTEERKREYQKTYWQTYRQRPGVRDRLRANSRKYYHSHSLKANATTLAWREANPEWVKNYYTKYNLGREKFDTNLRYRYGISADDYDRLLCEQQGLCAICQRPPGARRFHVDHDHSTGIVRGLLCGTCNQGIGLLRHDPDQLLKAIAYLTRGD